MATEDPSPGPPATRPPPASEAPGDDPAIVIAAALPRCGSTWLQRVIHETSDIFVWGESKMMYQLGPMTEFMRNWETGPGGKARQEFLRSNQDPTTWVANLCPPYEAYRQALAAFFRTYYAERHGKRRYGWKEIKYRRDHVELLWEVFPQLRVVLLIRNPADCLRSMKNLGARGVELWFPSFEEAATAWAQTADEYRALGSDPRALLLRYEDLEARLEEICRFAGGDPARAGRGLRTRVGASRPTAELTEAELRTLGEICTPAMKHHGYEIGELP